jgi:hypothetical protein
MYDGQTLDVNATSEACCAKWRGPQVADRSCLTSLEIEHVVAKVTESQNG